MSTITIPWETSLTTEAQYGYSLCVFNDKLYLATGNSHLLYVYDSFTWQVANIFSLDVDIKCLCVYKGKLYIGTGGYGKIYVYDGNTYELSYDMGSPLVSSLCVYNDKLYAGMGSTIPARSYVWCFDNTNWVLSLTASPETAIGDMYVYQGRLFAGTYPSGIIYVFDDSTWVISQDTPEDAITCFCEFENRLYAGTGANNNLYVLTGGVWSIAYTLTDEVQIYSMLVYNGRMFIGTCLGGKVFAYDGTTMELSYDSDDTFIFSLCIYQDKLFSSSGTYGGLSDVRRYAEELITATGDMSKITDYSYNMQYLLEQYKNSPKLVGLINSSNFQAEKIERALYELKELFYLNTAEGTQLDIIGNNIFGLPRLGLPDYTYRQAIAAKAIQSNSGTPESIIGAIRSLPDATFVEFHNKFPAEHAAYIVVTDAAFSQSWLESISPAGVECVSGGYLILSDGNYLTLADGSKIILQEN